MTCSSSCNVVRPSRLRWIPIGLAWAVILLLGLCSALMMGLNVVLVPCWLVAASSLGPLARELLTPRCADCGAPSSEVASAPGAADVAGRAARPADERAVEGALIGEAQHQRDLRDGVRVAREVGERELAS